MQQHMDIMIVLASLGIALMIFFAIKLFSKKNETLEETEADKNDPSIGNVNMLYKDEIIAVRKTSSSTDPDVRQVNTSEPSLEEKPITASQVEKAPVFVLHVMAKQDENFKGYELLQALLSQGLRFGEMSIFHRYQEKSGKGPVLFSLTSAVEPGTFDIHNMGSFSCPGLTLFMQASCQPNIDIERFDLMCTVAKNLARELQGDCLGHKRQSLTANAIEQYHQIIYQQEVFHAEAANAQ